MIFSLLRGYRVPRAEWWEPVRPRVSPLQGLPGAEQRHQGDDAQQDQDAFHGPSLGLIRDPVIS